MPFDFRELLLALVADSAVVVVAGWVVVVSIERESQSLSIQHMKAHEE